MGTNISGGIQSLIFLKPTHLPLALQVLMELALQNIFPGHFGPYELHFNGAIITS